MWSPDTFLMSLNAILGNKLRSVLTLVGIVAGVASIIAVMTAISVIQKTLEKEMSVLGAQTFQVQKWPAGGFHSAFPVSSASMIIFSSQTICQAISFAVLDFGSGR